MGEAIKERLDELGLSQRGLARRIGKSPSLISRIVNGYEKGSLDTIQAISDVLGLDLGSLISGNGAKPLRRGCRVCASINRKLLIKLDGRPELQERVLDLVETLER